MIAARIGIFDKNIKAMRLLELRNSDARLDGGPAKGLPVDAIAFRITVPGPTELPFRVSLRPHVPGAVESSHGFAVREEWAHHDGILDVAQGGGTAARRGSLPGPKAS